QTDRVRTDIIVPFCIGIRSEIRCGRLQKTLADCAVLQEASGANYLGVAGFDPGEFDPKRSSLGRVGRR
ncbi:MAG: hypothetical protein WB685_08335, partial [Pseudolabrys sp.]